MRPDNRTLVNKAVLQGLLSAAQIALPSLDTLDVHLVRASVVSIDPPASVLTLDNGQRLPYSILIAATGSTPRSHNPRFGESARLLHIHTVDDAARIRRLVGRNPACRVRRRRSVPGSSARRLRTHLADTGATRALGVPACGPARRRTRRAHRATCHRAASRARDNAFRARGRAVSAGKDRFAVTLDDGQVLVSDLAIVAHGTVPNVSLGNGHREGIAVDDRLRAVGLRRVYAAGSVAVHTGRVGPALSRGPLGRCDQRGSTRREDAAPRPCRWRGPWPLRALDRVHPQPVPTRDHRLRRRAPRAPWSASSRPAAPTPSSPLSTTQRTRSPPPPPD